MLFQEDDCCQNDITSFFHQDDHKKPIDGLSYIDDQFFSFLQLQRVGEPQKKSEIEPDDQFFSFLQLQRRSEVPNCEKINSGVVTRSKTKLVEPKDSKPLTCLAKRKKKPRKKNDSLNISDVWLSPDKDERMKLNELWNCDDLSELDAYLADESYDSPYVPYFDEFHNFDILEQYEPELKRKNPPVLHTGGKWKPVETGGKFKSLTPTESKCRSPLFEPCTAPVAKKRTHDDVITCAACRKTVGNKNLAKHFVSMRHFQKFRNDDAVHVKQILAKIDEIVVTSPFQCNICRFFCNSADDLKTHWENTAHAIAPDSYFLCCSCNIRLDCSEDVFNHLGARKHTQATSIKKRLKVQCDVCLLDFGLRIRLAQHMETAHSLRYIGCDSCDWVGFSQKGLQVHVRRVHGDSLHFCTNCNEYFQTAQDALIHRKTTKHRKLCGKDDSGDKLTICCKCGERFSSPQALSHHTLLGCEFPNKRDEKMLHQCRICCFGCEKKADLLFHETQHNNRSDELIACPECSKYFFKKGLKTHLLSHTLEYKFTCNECGKGFSKNQRLLAHMAKHERTSQGGGGTVYNCMDCNYSTKISSHLKRHQLSHNEVRKFQCPRCDFKAKILENLKRHLKTHSGVKPYKCPYCDYSCNLLENLRKHVIKKKTHNGRTLYECPWCSFGTNLGKSFDEHLNHNHTEAYEAKGKFQTWEIYRPRKE